jgi:hypothetical protein
MPFLPLQQKPFKNIESEASPQAFEQFVDMVKDDFLSNKTRPGLGGNNNDSFADIGTSIGVDGLFYVRNANIAAAFSGGRLFKITNVGVVTEITGATISTGTPVTYAEFGTAGYFCNNSAILKWTYANNTCSLLSDPQAPTDATHIAFLDSYAVALRANSQQFEWSAVDDPDNWDGSFAQAESRPDNAQALHSHFGELFIPGTSTTEFWTTTGSSASPFQRFTGTSHERGCIAPYSVTQIDNTYFYMDNERRIIRLTGRSPQIISNPYDIEFQKLGVVEDAIGMSVNANGLTLYVLTFPTSQRTFFYDYKLDYWGEWSYWNTTNVERDHFLGQHGVYMDSWNKYLVGSRIDGKIFCLDDTYSTDEGGILLSEMWTGRINWGTNNRKSCLKLKIRLKRGLGSGELFVYHRDNGKSAWSNPYEIDLGELGENEDVVTLRRLGTYYDRQWRFTCTGQTTIISAEETVEGL